MSESIRAFIAFELSEEIKHELQQVQEQLADKKDKVKWVAQDNIHLTLKFLGDVPHKEIAAIQKIILNVADKFCTFKMRIKAVGCFPNDKLPRIVWAGVREESKALEDIYNSLENELAAIGYLKEERLFKPHLTIGRVKHISDRTRFKTGIDETKTSDFGEVNVKEIVLFKSTLTSKGAIYEKVYSAELKKKQ